MLTEIMMATLLIAIGFAIFLLANLQKGFLIKVFSWFVAVVVMMTGVIYAVRIVTPEIFNKAKSRISSDMTGMKNAQKKSNPMERVYKKSNIDHMFDEIGDTVK